MRTQQDLKYPIGPFTYGQSYTLDETRRNIKAIARLPKQIKKALKKLSNSQLESSYRKGGWTVRQVINHIADSHMNAYIRMKLAVTEHAPVIKLYEEALWAETEDGKNGSVKLSLKLLSALHRRWVNFLESLSEEDLERGYFNPEKQRLIPLTEAIALYAWHSRHHLGHIRIVTDNKSQTKEPDHKPEAPKTAARKGRPAKTVSKSAAPQRKPRQPKPAEVAKAAAQPETTRRTRRTKAEMEAFRAAQAAQPKLTRAEILAKARAARQAKSGGATAAKPKKAATQTEGPKLTRAEILAKARAARQVKSAGAAVAQPAKTAKAKAPAQPKAAKTDAPKLTRAEILAKARAARQAKSASAAKPSPQGKPKTAAAKPEGPKLSRAEILAKARAARQAKIAEQGPKTPTKTAKPEGQKLSRAEILAKARAARGKNKSE